MAAALKAPSRRPTAGRRKPLSGHSRRKQIGLGRVCRLFWRREFNLEEAERRRIIKIHRSAETLIDDFLLCDRGHVDVDDLGEED
ncbi:Hypothetical predicted protein [Xyrichtys novacula]|uniref:Uncharacterized protein n=1 Tax=Xyrichtys novacula TaxID=13765 RepID=A0AAV1GHH7_XYRNO|nr:Hypothetical predicted protein [Xyrichtys novacula]